jgi:hypothetical protein
VQIFLLTFIHPFRLLDPVLQSHPFDAMARINLTFAWSSLFKYIYTNIHSMLYRFMGDIRLYKKIHTPLYRLLYNMI